MKRRAFFVLPAVWILACAASVEGAERPDPQKIEAAIVKAKGWLYKQQNKDGNWELAPAADRNPNLVPNSTEGLQWGGMTALCTYAMLASGDSARDPKLAPAIEWLTKAPLEGTYALAFRMMVYMNLPKDDGVRALANKDMQTLIKRMKTEGMAKGMYGYSDEGKSYSHSRAQYGVLGVWAGLQMNLEPPTGYWKVVQEAWIRNQDVSGGWGYVHPKDIRPSNKDDGYEPSPGMTAAGIATMFLTYDGLGSPVQCNGNPKMPEIERALAYMATDVKRFASEERFKHDFPMPTVFAVERVGLATGLRYFGTTDWFKKGSDFLLKQQDRDGSIATGRRFAVQDTGFAILFLTRGRVPIVMQKLDYSISTGGKAVEGPWNQRPRDVANVTKWIGKQAERELKWQIASLEFPVEDLLDSQILFISGNKPLGFTEEEEKKLREYVQRGGMILGHADCNEAAFATSFQKLGAKLFPMYELRDLPEDHPIYTRQLFPRKTWATKPRVQGLSNGVRELMVLLPAGDPGRSWAMNAIAAGQVNFQLMTNIFLYANDKTKLRNAGQTYVIETAGKGAGRAVKVARLEYGGNFDPEPAGLPRLGNYLANTHGTRLDVEVVKLGNGGLKMDFAVAFLTGTTAFSLNEGQRKEIADYVNGGGTLVVDAAGGREAFTVSAKEELALVFAGGKLVELPKAHAIYTVNKLPEVEYRNFVRSLGGVEGGALDAPRLKGMEVGKRMGVIFSAEDLSYALVGSPTDGVNGYAPEYALPLVANMVLTAGK